MRRLVPALMAALGLGLVGAGVVVFAVTNTSRAPQDVGWTAYAPLESSAYRSELSLSFDDPWTVLWTGDHVLGALLVVAGLLALAAVGGWWLGRRSAARS